MEKVIRELNFGKVLAHDYMYVNFCDGPDFFMFKLEKEKSDEFIEVLDSEYSKAEAEFKKGPSINEDGDEIHFLRNDYAINDEDPNFIIFHAFLLSDFKINGRVVTPGRGINIIDKMNVADYKISCSIVTDDTDFGKLFQLRLDSIEVETDKDLFIE